MAYRFVHFCRKQSALAVLLIATGCASTYQPPGDDDQSSVPVSFVNHGPAAGVFIRKSPDACSTTSDAGRVGVVGQTKLPFPPPKYEIRSRLAAGVPSTISMGWWDVGPVRECGEKITFTPVAGMEYKVGFEADYESHLGLSDVKSCEVRVLARPIRSEAEFTPFSGPVQRTRENICIK